MPRRPAVWPADAHRGCGRRRVDERQRDDRHALVVARELQRIADSLAAARLLFIGEEDGVTAAQLAYLCVPDVLEIRWSDAHHYFGREVSSLFVLLLAHCHGHASAG
eukprot:5391262-Prymnesium_polylepis.1